METKILEELGLSNAEIKIFIKLLELGHSKAGLIIEKTGLQSSTIYHALHGLIDKGLVSYIKKGQIKYYQAADPEIIINFIESKKQEFQKILPELKAKQKLAKEKQEAEIFEGIRGITTMLNILIEDAKPGDEYYFFAVDVRPLNIEIQKFFERYDAKRKAKKLIVRGLAPKRLKPLFEKRKYLKMKYVNYPIPANISICNDKMVMISWGEKPRGILIYSKQIVQSQIEFFTEIWSRKT